MSTTPSQPSGLFARAFRTKGNQTPTAKYTTSPPQTAESPPPVPQFPIASPPPPRRHRKSSSRHSISSSVTELGSTLRRSASLRTTSPRSSGSTSSHRKTPSTATLATTLSLSPEKAPASNASRPALSISTFSRGKQKSAENVKALDSLAVGLGGGQPYSKSPLSAVDQPKTPFGMAVPLRYPASQKQLQQQQQTFAQSYGSLGPPAPIQIGPAGNGSNNPSVVFQHIHEMASKRISTLDYLRKAHEGRIYWFNTLLFSKPDLARLSYFSPPKLARRATNYLLLGFSLPTILDLHPHSPSDYLRALNALLIEFESYQSIHPPDGATPSSLSRGRIPQMFRKATHVGVGSSKGRRSSAATDMGFPALDHSISNASTPPDSTTSSSLPITTGDDLLPNETYTHLLTPSLPFDPDFFETFATLCDVLIDAYTKMMSLVSGPESCSPVVGDLFAKADARVRKIILAGVVREFEDASRVGQR
ncbi:hypothetical protein BU16DRAFT_585458, partial [Lophium mytilinum]